WPASSSTPATARATACENTPSNPSSARSSRPGASDNSSCEASTRPEASGRSSAPPTTSSSWRERPPDQPHRPAVTASPPSPSEYPDRLLAAPDVRHLSGHHGHELHVGRERQAGHVDDGGGHVGDVHHRLGRELAVRLRHALAHGHPGREVGLGVADVDLAAGDV